MLGDEAYQSSPSADQPRPTTLTRDAMIKRLKHTKYPRRSVFYSFDGYVDALRSHVEALQKQGIDDTEIAIHLNAELLSSELGPSYAPYSRKMEPISLDGVFAAVKSCDKESSLLTGSEKFHGIMQGPNESRFSLMKRLENAFVDYQMGDPSDYKAMLRIVRKQFCIAASLPPQVVDNVRHCQDLDDVVICANEDMASIELEQRQNAIKPVANGHGFSRSSYPASHKQQHMQQLMQQQQQVPQSNGNVLSLTKDRPSPDPSLHRAPSGLEFDRAFSHILICLRCRVINQHIATFCPYKKFCSHCWREGHTDFEHRDVTKVRDESGSSAAAQPPQQQQQQP